MTNYKQFQTILQNTYIYHAWGTRNINYLKKNEHKAIALCAPDTKIDKTVFLLQLNYIFMKFRKCVPQGNKPTITYKTK